MNWTTWENIGIDRQACAWFIRKYVDPDAVFSFVARDTAITDTEHSFDTPSSKWTHRQGRSTFAMFTWEYQPKDPILKEMAEIIDGADTANDILPPPEAYGLEAICVGIRAGCSDDFEALEKSTVVFDGLYEYIKGKKGEQ
ncbi:MAG: chromate resistance protein [Treponema sp.]|nr:chromate resistance protein [Treponema sp.]